jgi:outer membrane protein assembly factor BamE (lipoprotein component of BamABCDE complex)
MRATILAIAIVALFCGCMSVHTGNDFDASKVSQIKKGETNESQLITMFGQPNQRTTNSQTGNSLTWIYSQGNVGLGGATSTNKTLTAFINQAGVVTDYSYSTGAFDSRAH